VKPQNAWKYHSNDVIVYCDFVGLENCYSLGRIVGWNNLQNCGATAPYFVDMLIRGIKEHN
jgi:hypothetical protein